MDDSETNLELNRILKQRRKLIDTKSKVIKDLKIETNFGNTQS